MNIGFPTKLVTVTRPDGGALQIPAHPTNQSVLSEPGWNHESWKTLFGKRVASAERRHKTGDEFAIFAAKRMNVRNNLYHLVITECGHFVLNSDVTPLSKSARATLMPVMNGIYCIEISSGGEPHYIFTGKHKANAFIDRAHAEKISEAINASIDRYGH